MNPKCHRCQKTVFPVEKLSCLDKAWHKGCFNCETCRMTLSMKTYKGYQKLPYCNTHYPTTQFTAVADTPENLRLKKNTTNISNVVYHRDFEKEKGKFTAVADDPETLRNKKTQQQASDLAYAKKTQPNIPLYDPPSASSRDPAPVPAPIQAPVPPEPEEARSPPAVPSQESGPKYIAIYDYTAADDDEVSFIEGDVIVNGEHIDDGWMTGTVSRTGETGMLPSNYVEQA